MPDNPAQTLTNAAQKLREHAGFLHLHDVRGPWRVHSGPTGYPQSVSNVGVPIHVADTFTDPKAPPVVANYIALMHPGVGLALADWLETVAIRLHHSTHPEWQENVEPHAFAVARQILGEVES